MPLLEGTKMSDEKRKVRFGDFVEYDLTASHGGKVERAYVAGEMAYSKGDVVLLATDGFVGMPINVSHCKTLSRGHFEKANELRSKYLTICPDSLQPASPQGAQERWCTVTHAHQPHDNCDGTPQGAQEGETLRDAASNLVDFLLDSRVAIGPFRSRADYPPQLNALIISLATAPPSAHVARGEGPLDHDAILDRAQAIVADYASDSTLETPVLKRGITDELLLAKEVIWLREFRGDAIKKLYNICRVMEEPDGPRAYTTEERELFIGENERLSKENTALERRLNAALEQVKHEQEMKAITDEAVVQATQRAAGLEPDAKRYRFLRSRITVPYAMQSFLRHMNWHPDTFKLADTDGAIDAAIDAALKGQP